MVVLGGGDEKIQSAAHDVHQDRRQRDLRAQHLGHEHVPAQAPLHERDGRVEQPSLGLRVRSGAPGVYSVPVIPRLADAPRESAARGGSSPADGLGDAVRAHVRRVSAYPLYLLSPRRRGAGNPLGPNAGARGGGVVDRGAGAGTHAWLAARQG